MGWSTCLTGSILDTMWFPPSRTGGVVEWNALTWELGEVSPGLTVLHWGNPQ